MKALLVALQFWPSLVLLIPGRWGLIDAWPTLSDDARDAIVRLAGAALTMLTTWW